MGIIAIKSSAVMTPALRTGEQTHSLLLKSEAELTALGLRFALTELVSAVLPRGRVSTFKTAIDIAQQLKKLSEAERRELKEWSADYVPMFPDRL